MARKKKVKAPLKHFSIDDYNKEIIIVRDELPNLQDFENDEIKLYQNLGYKINIIEEKVTPKKKTFTYEKAVKYLRKNHKNELPVFNEFKAEANKLSEAYKELKKSGNASAEELDKARAEMIIAQRNAFKEQKEWFKAKYGEEAYKEVRLYY